jgi:hypothetical protein
MGRIAEPLNMGRAIAVCFGCSPPPRRRAAKAHRAPRQKTRVIGRGRVPSPLRVILKTRDLATFLCKIRFLKDLDIKIREIKDLEPDGLVATNSAIAITMLS